MDNDLELSVTVIDCPCDGGATKILVVNGSYLFNRNTVHVSDGSRDELDGGSGADWFIADELGDGDKIKDHAEDIFGLDADWFNLD